MSPGSDSRYVHLHEDTQLSAGSVHSNEFVCERDCGRKKNSAGKRPILSSRGWPCKEG